MALEHWNALCNWSARVNTFVVLMNQFQISCNLSHPRQSRCDSDSSLSLSIVTRGCDFVLCRFT